MQILEAIDFIEKIVTNNKACCFSNSNKKRKMIKELKIEEKLLDTELLVWRLEPSTL